MGKSSRYGMPEAGRALRVALLAEILFIHCGIVRLKRGILNAINAIIDF